MIVNFGYLQRQVKKLNTRLKKHDIRLTVIKHALDFGNSYDLKITRGKVIMTDVAWDIHHAMDGMTLLLDLLEGTNR
jgi:hypothetical protein